MRRRILAMLLLLCLLAGLFPTAALASEPGETAETEPQADTVTVTFDVNGGTLSTYNTELEKELKITVGTVIPENKIPTGQNVFHNEKAFAGWYENKELVEGDTPFDFSTSITSDLTLYAHWVEGSNVSFNKNGGNIDGMLSMKRAPAGKTLPDWI